MLYKGSIAKKKCVGAGSWVQKEESDHRLEESSRGRRNLNLEVNQRKAEPSENWANIE